MSGAPTHASSSPRAPWAWVPTLYFGQGLPFVAVTVLSVVCYKNLGVSNRDIALVTSSFYLPWVIKPLWSPLVDLHGLKRTWVLGFQAVLAAGFLLLGLAFSLPDFLLWTSVLFWGLALASATHDIAADGFYLLALSERQQAAFVGLRSAFYRVAMVVGQGGLVGLAGWLMARQGNPRVAWSLVFALLGLGFGALFLWHRHRLPVAERPGPGAPSLRLSEGLATFRSYIDRPGMGLALAYLLTFRLGEAQALKLVLPFLMDPRERGGLGLSNAQVGFAYGTVGVACLTLGGLAGGWLISRWGLRRCLWPMTAGVHLPNLAFVALAFAQPKSLALTAGAIALEQFGYGFGFTAYLMYLVLLAEGPTRTSHYALGTGLMAMGMMLPGLGSGWIQERLGYLGFFGWVCLSCLPSVLLTPFLRIDPEFGRREAA